MGANRNQGDSGNQGRSRAPEWADGLKQLYDSVVEEDLPDAFKDLLEQLGTSGPAAGSNDNGAPPQSPDGRDAGK
jgi:hypothetical protein